jgi:hypothetical protein
MPTQASAKPARDTFTASATVHRTPRVSIVLSSYKGGGDHFGNAKFEGLPEPRGIREELSAAQVRAMTRHAVRLGNHPNRGFRRIVGANESVVLLAGAQAEPSVVSALAEMLREEAGGVRVTILSPEAIATAETVRMPAPGVWSRRDVEYRIPKAVLECDRLIPIAPFRLDKGRPSLILDAYRTLSPAAANGTPDVVAMDLFGFHPAEFAVLGGTHVLRDGTRVRHNLILAGPMPAAVDAVGCAVLNLKPADVGTLQLAEKRGFGGNLDEVWTLGNEIEEARLTS